MQLILKDDAAQYMTHYFNYSIFTHYTLKTFNDQKKTKEEGKHFRSKH